MQAIFLYGIQVALRCRQPHAVGLSPIWQSSLAAVTVTQRREKHKKYGGFTRDPFKSFQKKLAREQSKRHSKAPLKSEERAQMELSYPLNVNSLGQVIASYVPLEKFAKAPVYTKLGLSQRRTAFKEGLSIVYAGAVIRRKLRKVDPFRPIEFARKAQLQFIDVNSAIQAKDKNTLRALTTENASESLKQEFQNKTFTWKVVEELERPRVVNARVIPFLKKENLFAQVVVRMHTKQIMAVYNLAGKVIQGHASRPKDVIDYVVFERFLSQGAGSSWRVAAKLPPQVPWKKAIEGPGPRLEKKALPA